MKKSGVTGSNDPQCGLSKAGSSFTHSRTRHPPLASTRCTNSPARGFKAMEVDACVCVCARARIMCCVGPGQHAYTSSGGPF